ncbi:MAG TPA: hypothetical protein VKQ32_04160 [Polyangia bacterium]|nr:hypothetical protein [Polyangia bacterium]
MAARLFIMALAGALGVGCLEARPLPSGAAPAPTPPTSSDPSLSPCAPDLPARLALVAALGTDVMFVMSDGSSRSVYRFDSYAPAGALSFSAGLAVRGDNVVATASWWGTADDQCHLQDGNYTCPETDRLVLLDREGRVLWEKMRSQRASSASIGIGARVGAAGWVVLSDATGSVLVAPDGTETKLPAEVVASRPFPGPALPAVLSTVEAGKRLFAWWQPDRPVAATAPPIALPDSTDWFDAGDQLDFVGRAPDGTTVLVHSGPDGTAVLPGQLDLGTGAPTTWSGSWRAIDDGASVVRYDLVTGTTGRFVWALPAGMRALARAAIGHDGSFIQLLRDDNVAEAFVTDDGSTWTPVGRTLGKVETGSVQDVAGTYLVVAEGTDQFFVPTQQWPENPSGQTPELVGSSVQLVRPSTGVAAVIAPAWSPVVLSTDGVCAAYWEETASGTRLVMYDLAHDTRTAPLETHAASPPAFAFVE